MTNIHGPCALSLASLFASSFPVEFVCFDLVIWRCYVGCF